MFLSRLFWAFKKRGTKDEVGGKLPHTEIPWQIFFVTHTYIPTSLQTYKFSNLQTCTTTLPTILWFNNPALPYTYKPTNLQIFKPTNLHYNPTTPRTYNLTIQSPCPTLHQQTYKAYILTTIICNEVLKWDRVCKLQLQASYRRWQCNGPPDPCITKRLSKQDSTVDPGAKCV